MHRMLVPARRAALASFAVAVLAHCGAEAPRLPGVDRAAALVQIVLAFSTPPPDPATAGPMSTSDCVPIGVKAVGFAVLVDQVVTISSDSGTAEFFSDAACTVAQGSDIPFTGTSSAPVFLRDRSVGQWRLTVSDWNSGSISAPYAVVRKVMPSFQIQPRPVLAAGASLGVIVLFKGDPGTVTVTSELCDASVTPPACEPPIHAYAAVPGSLSIDRAPVRAGGRFQLHVKVVDTGADAWSDPFAVVAAPPYELQLPTFAPVRAGALLPPFRIAATDLFGNPAANEPVVIREPAASLGGVTTGVTDANGAASFSGMYATAAGSWTLGVSVGTDVARPLPVVVLPGATIPTFSGMPSRVAAGTPFDVQVSVKDAYGNDHAEDVTVSVPGATQVLTPSGGVAAGTFTITTAGTHFVNAALSDTFGGYSGTASIVVTAAASASVGLSPVPGGGVIAGAPFAIAASVVDRFGNPVPGVTVDLAPEAAPGVAVAGTRSRVTDSAGIATFDDLSIQTAAASCAITASAGGLSTSTPPFAVLSATPVVAFTAEPPVALSADASFDVTVLVQDAYGNPVAGDVTLSVEGSAGAVLEGTTVRATDATGAVSFPGLAIRRAGTGYRLVASAGGQDGRGALFDVLPAIPDAAGLTLPDGPPSGVVAGAPFAVSVQLLDPYRNPVAANVTLALVDEAAGGASGVPLLGTTTRATVAATGVATFDGLSVEQVGTYRLTAQVTAPASLARTSGAFAVGPAAASVLAFVRQPAAAPPTADDEFLVAVRVADAYGNAVDATVGLELLLGDAVVPLSTTAASRSAATAAGVAEFPGVAVRQAGGPYRLRATVASPALALTSTPVTIAPGVATTVAFTTPPPGSVAAGATFVVAARVTDAWVNPISTAVALTLSAANDAALSGPVSLESDPSGVVTFAGLSIAKAGAGYALTAATTSPALGATASLDVTPATGVVAVIGGPPAMLTADATFAVTVSVRDVYDNPVATAVTLELAPESLAPGSDATLSGPVTGATDGTGVVSFDGLAVRRAGAGYRIAATAAGRSGQGDPFDVTPATPTAAGLTFVADPPQPLVAGAPFSAVVRLLDPYGNPIVTPVRLALAGAAAAGAALAGTTTRDTAADTGAATFDGLSIARSGRYALTASVSTPVALTATGAAVDVTPAAPAALRFVRQPLAAPSADEELEVAVRVADAYDNPVDATVVVTIVSANDAVMEVTTTTASLAAATTAGIAVFPHLAVRKAGGPYQIRADVAWPPLAGTSEDVTVHAGAAAALRFRTFTATTGQQGVPLPSISVGVEDAWGNGVPAATAPVSLSIGAGPAGATMTGGDARAPDRGVATFSDVVLSMPGTYRLRAADGALTALAPEPTLVLAPGSTNPAHHLAFTEAPGPQVDLASCSGFRVEVHDEGTAYVAPRRISMTRAVVASLSRVAGLSFHPDAGCDASEITTVAIGLSGVGEFHVRAKEQGSYTVALYANLSGQNGSTAGLQSVTQDLRVGERGVDTAPAKEDLARPLNGWSAGCGAGGGAPSALGLLALAAAAVWRAGRRRSRWGRRR